MHPTASFFAHTHVPAAIQLSAHAAPRTRTQMRADRVQRVHSTLQHTLSNEQINAPARDCINLEPVAPPLAPVGIPLGLAPHQEHQQQADIHFMLLALGQAKKGAAIGEVPVGAVLVSGDGQVLHAAHNLTHTSCNPVAHAEMRCIMHAAEQRQAWRLMDATLYTTLEPCPMCAGAILQSRIARLVYGAPQPRLGADGSWVSLFPPVPSQNAAQQFSRETRPASSQVWQPSNILREEEHGMHGNGGGRSNEDDSKEGESEKVCSSVGRSSEGLSVLGHGNVAHSVEGHSNEDDSKEGDSMEDQSNAGHSSEGLSQMVNSIGSDSYGGSQRSDSCSESLDGNRQRPEPVAALPHPFHNQIRVERGVLQEECAQVMKDFFRARRQESRLAQQAAA